MTHNDGAGQVWLAKQRGSKVPLAVKMMNDTSSVSDCEDFLLETETMAKMGMHKHITSLIGASLQEQPWLVAIEFMKYASYQQLLWSPPPPTRSVHYYFWLQFCFLFEVTRDGNWWGALPLKIREVALYALSNIC